MQVNFNNVGKRFNREWIFKGLDFVFKKDTGYAILGGNGSGKSTLIQVVSGFGTISTGEITYELNSKKILREKIYQYVSMTAPYLDILEELTLEEAINFHRQFKNFPNITISELAKIFQLEKAKSKEIRYYSSGMKQRVKLGLSILSECPILLLDEPVSNLDINGIDWYNNLLKTYAKGKLVLICSNQGNEEHGFCTEQLKLEDYKN